MRTWDYGSADTYFVTLVTRGRQRLFGDAADNIMALSPAGEIAAEEWKQSAVLRSDVELDAFVIMPDHMHGIVFLNRGGARPAPTSSLTSLIGCYKSAVSRRLGRPIWQRSFFDHIVRNEHDLDALRDYIEGNPGRWFVERELPLRAGHAPPLHEGGL